MWWNAIVFLYSHTCSTKKFTPPLHSPSGNKFASPASQWPFPASPNEGELLIYHIPIISTLIARISAVQSSTGFCNQSANIFVLDLVFKCNTNNTRQKRPLPPQSQRATVTLNPPVQLLHEFFALMTTHTPTNRNVAQSLPPKQHVCLDWAKPREWERDSKRAKPPETDNSERYTTICYNLNIVNVYYTCSSAEATANLSNKSVCRLVK